MHIMLVEWPTVICSSRTGAVVVLALEKGLSHFAQNGKLEENDVAGDDGDFRDYRFVYPGRIPFVQFFSRMHSGQSSLMVPVDSFSCVSPFSGVTGQVSCYVPKWMDGFFDACEELGLLLRWA